MDTRRYRKFPVQNGALMRINDVYGIQNGTNGVNNDLPLVDDAVLSENKKTAALFSSSKGAVGFFSSQETKNVSGRTANYTKTGAFGNISGSDGLGKKILGMYDELCAGPGAVRAVLHRYVDEESAKWGKQIWK